MQKTTYDLILEDLKSKHRGQTLNVRELAIEANMSASTIRRGIIARKGIPPFRIGGAGAVKKFYVFPIVEVAKFLSNTQVIADV